MATAPARGLRASTGPTGYRPLRAGHLLLVALVVGSCALAYGSTVVVSYFANGLDAVPLSQVATAPGSEDPLVLPSAASASVGYMAILLTPFAAVAGALVVGADLVDGTRAGRPLRALLPPMAVLALCLAVLTVYAYLGPLTSWWLD